METINGEWFMKGCGRRDSVCLHSPDGGKSYELGILIAPKYRGRGFSGDALRLLADYAFNTLGAEALTNRFEKTREAAVRLHLSLGFTAEDEGGGMLFFTLRREDFFANEKPPKTLA